MKPFYLLPFLLLLLSCENEREAQIKRDIVGEWKYIEDFDSIPYTDSLLPPPPPLDVMYDFSVLDDTTYLDKSGYWKKNENEPGGLIYYSGRKTKYKIKDSMLMVFNPVEKNWYFEKIYSLNGDTLIYKLEAKKYRRFTRQHYKINPNEKYDAIIVSASPCFGSCPIADVRIDRNGTVTYQGSYNNLKNGNFTATISAKDYLALEREFKKAGIDSLETYYAATHTDDQTITVTFIKDGKIYRTISDYGFQSPSELRSACNQARFLYQQLELKEAALPYPDLRQGYVGFDKSNKSCVLEMSEQFFLVTELEKAKPVRHVFNGKFIFQFGKYGHKKFIVTDGRYYKLPPEDGGETLDLGYNFIERNGLEKRFEKHE
ncbi:DUF6438 domain-containing protein [Flavobacterium sp. RHBU_24]|uniref:DUF6438 domain-containing protein n=1 Tax=Flavobacterium sp. RHBU_24 TaxID=3391185 RepID=UPI003984663C